MAWPLEFAAEAVFLHEAVRLGHASEALERLRELASTTTGLLVPVFAAHAEALVRNDSGALEEVPARFEIPCCSRRKQPPRRATAR